MTKSRAGTSWLRGKAHEWEGQGPGGGTDGNGLHRPHAAPRSVQLVGDEGCKTPEAVDVLLDSLADELADRWGELDEALITACEASFRRLSRPNPFGAPLHATSTTSRV